LDHLANLESERIEREWLGHHLHARLEEWRTTRRMLGIPGDEQDLQVRPVPACDLGDLPSVQAGKTDVRDQQSRGVLEVSMGSAAWPSLASMQA
jgi:hypothetical protein